MMGVTMTMRKLKSQFVHVEIALAFALVLIGEISAGYSQGKGSQVAPKDLKTINIWPNTRSLA
jgi:hypothetical protein